MPIKIHVVSAIPRSAAQKIQRWKLAEQLGQPRLDKSDRPSDHVKVDVLEEVQHAWKQELGTRPAQPTDSFFGSGAGSMQAAALASNLSSRLKMPLEAALVFRHSQPQDLASVLENKLLEVCPCQTSKGHAQSYCLKHQGWQPAILWERREGKRNLTSNNGITRDAGNAAANRCREQDPQREGV